MRLFNNTLSNWHIAIFGVLFGAFTVCTYLIADEGVDDGFKHNRLVWMATAGVIAGPLTGAISRDFQGCCLEFSLAIMTYVAPILAIGLLAPFIRLPDKKWIRILQFSLWTLGWMVWFMGGILSFAHALS